MIRALSPFLSFPVLLEINSGRQANMSHLGRYIYASRNDALKIGLQKKLMGIAAAMIASSAAAASMNTYSSGGEEETEEEKKRRAKARKRGYRL